MPTAEKAQEKEQLPRNESVNILYCKCNAEGALMKSATIPPLRVTPSLRDEAESLLQEGETLSSFVEESLRKHIERRKLQQAFIARGIASRDRARATGHYVSKDDLMRSLQSIREKTE